MTTLPTLEVDFNALANVGSIRLSPAQVASLVPTLEPLQRCLAIDDHGNTCQGLFLPGPLRPDGRPNPRGALLFMDWTTWQDGPEALEEE